MQFKLAELFVELTAKDKVSKKIDTLRTRVKRLQAELDKLATSARRVFMVMAGSVVGATMAFAGFEQEMARVKAMTHSTAAEFEALTAKALQMGATTVFSSKQAAEAMAIFALMGFKVNEIMGMLGPTLDLAAIGQLNMGDAAKITAGIMRGMRLESEDLGHVVDVLAAAITSSAADLHTLGNAFRMLGPVGVASSQTLEELTASIQLMSNAMISGEMAGTALRNILLRLQIQPLVVADAIDVLGIKVSNSSGKLKHLSVIIDDVKKATAGYTEVQKTAIFAQIAGLRSAAAFQVLIQKGGKVMREYEAALREATGAGAEMKRIMLDTLTGSFKLLWSQVTNLGIAIGGSLSPTFRSLSQIIGSVLPPLAKFVTANQTAIIAVVGLTTAITGFIIIAPKLLFTLTTIASHPIVAVILALTTAFVFLTAAAIDYVQVSQALTKRINANSLALEQEIALEHEMASELKSLMALKTRSEVQEERLAELATALMGEYDNLTLTFDTLGKALGFTTDQWEELNAQMQRSVHAKASEEMNEIVDALDELDEKSQKVKKAQLTWYDPTSAIGTIKGWFGAKDPFGDQERVKRMEELEKRRKAVQKRMDRSAPGATGPGGFTPKGADPLAGNLVREAAKRRRFTEAYRDMLSELVLLEKDTLARKLEILRREADERAKILAEAPLDAAEKNAIGLRIFRQFTRDVAKARAETAKDENRLQKAKDRLIQEGFHLQMSLEEKLLRAQGKTISANLLALESWYKRTKTRLEALQLPLDKLNEAYAALREEIAEGTKGRKGGLAWVGLTSLTAAIQSSLGDPKHQLLQEQVDEQKKTNTKLDKVVKRLAPEISFNSGPDYQPRSIFGVVP